MKLKFLVILSSIFCFFTSHAYIYQIKVVKKWIPEKEHYQKVYLFSDCHPDGKSRQQCNEILRLLRTLNKRDSLIIVEDKSYYTGSHRGMIRAGSFLATNSYSEILHGLAKICRRHLLTLVNAECRFVVGSFKDIFKGYINKQYQNQSHFDWTINYFHMNFASLEDEYNQINSLLKEYNDPAFNEFYSLVLKQLSLYWQQLKYDFLDWKKTYGDSKEFIDYLLATFPENALFQLYNNHLCYCVDAKALHTIFHANQEHIYVFMGGAHIRTIHAYLNEAGFQLDQYYGFFERNYSEEETNTIIKEKNLSNWVEEEEWFWDNALDEPIDPVIFRIFHHKKPKRSLLKNPIFICTALTIGGYLLYANKEEVFEKCSTALKYLKEGFYV